MSKCLGRGALGLTLALGVFTAGGTASAQTEAELNEARAAFREALALSAAGNCAAALVKYRRVAEIKNSANVAFNMAECQEKLGNLVAALGNYRLAVAKAADAKSAKEVDPKVVKEAPGRIEALEKRVPKLIVERTNDVGTVEIDSVEIGSAQLGREFPVDPGTHVVIAKIDGSEVARERVTVAESETGKVKLKVKMPEGKKRPDPKPDEDPLPPKKEPPPPPPEPSKVPAIVVLSTGVAALVVGGVFIGLRQASLDKLNTLCGGDTTCPVSAKPTYDEGKTFTGVAEGAVITGVVGLGVGIALFVVASQKPKAPEPPKEKAAAERPRFSFSGAAPGADLGGGSVVVRY